MGVVKVTPRRLTPLPIDQEAGWALRPGAENLVVTGIRSPCRYSDYSIPAHLELSRFQNITKFVLSYRVVSYL